MILERLEPGRQACGVVDVDGTGDGTDRRIGKVPDELGDRVLIEPGIGVDRHENIGFGPCHGPVQGAGLA